MGYFSSEKGGDERVVEGDIHAVSSSYEVNADYADQHIKRLRDQHRFDPFMEIEKLDAVDAVIEGGDAEKEAAVEASLLGENSPYAEVRNSVCPPPHFLSSRRSMLIHIL